MFKHLFLGRLLLAIFVSLFSLTLYASDDNGIVTGQVIGIDGMPIEDVIITTNDASPAISDAGGLFILTGVVQDERVLVNFHKAGYLQTQATMSFTLSNKRDEEDDHDRDDEDEYDDDDEDDEKDDRGDKSSNDDFKLTRLSVVQTMIKLGDKQMLSSAVAGSFMQDGYKVTFSANSLNVTGDIDLMMTPIDITGNAINASPGDFSARTKKGKRVKLESFSMVDVTLSQSGIPVNLKTGATAELELLLADNSLLQLNSNVPMWYFDSKRGLWQEEGTGTVGKSTTTMGRLAVFATVSHFTPWNVDRVIRLPSSIYGLVLDKNNTPLAGVRILLTSPAFASGIYTRTDVNGRYCIPASLNQNMTITATYSIDGIGISSGFVNASTGNARGSCAGGGAYPAPDIILSTATSCVSGQVLDSDGMPQANVPVILSNGGSGSTDDNGNFKIIAIENTAVQVQSPGLPIETVTTPAAGTNCATVTLQPVPTVGTNTCVSGIVFTCDINSPRENISVTVSAGNEPLFLSNPTNAQGLYCVDGIPANTNLTIQKLNSGFNPIIPFNSGVAGGTCALNNCTVAPGLDIDCF